MNPTRFVRRSLGLLTAGLLVASCSESPAGPQLSLSQVHLVSRAMSSPNAISQATIGPSGGVLAIAGGHSISFPAGALSAPTTITAVSDGSTVKVDFGPEGLLFPDSASPTLTYSYEGAAGVTDANAGGLAIAYLNDDGSIDQLLPSTVDTIANVVRSKIHHFSTYAMATD